MKFLCACSLLVCGCVSAASAIFAQQLDATLPHLEKRGAATQLIVDGKPFFMLSGELHNSSSSSLEYMKPEWGQLAARGLNTVVTPASWELVEPTEGKYDFTLVDGLLAQAREQHMHIVFLWLAAWKNGVSSYPPAWVKRDTKRFPRVMQHGREIETLSTFGAATLQADGKAFAALMQHLHEVDSRDHTVLMMQVENEVGVLGSTRDHSTAAEKAFADTVPEELMRYLEAHHAPKDPRVEAGLNDELRALWEANGTRPAGTWTAVFGDSGRTDEIFMAWQYARYVQAVAAMGKRVYPLPMYVNAWLGGGDTAPGDYPSGGPQPRVLDIWKAAGSSLDMISPDLYASDFAGWTSRYHRVDNPLFIPETNGGTAGAANVFYAIGEQAAMGFSPFAIDAGLHGEPSANAEAATKGNAELARSYELLAEIMPQVLTAQANGAIHGFILDRIYPAVTVVIHGVTLAVSLDQVFGRGSETGYGLVFEDGQGSFVGAGRGFRVAFESRSTSGPQVGLSSVVEGRYRNGIWLPGRTLNGDENDQGSHWRFDGTEAKIERATIYHFD